MNKITICLALVISVFSLSACQSNQIRTKRVKAVSTCPDSMGGFRTGIDTSTTVTRCLKKPNHVNRNPDGRYVYIYGKPNGTLATFLFDKSDKIVNVSVYEKR